MNQLYRSTQNSSQSVSRKARSREIAWWSLFKVTSGSRVLRILQLGSAGTSRYIVPPMWKGKGQKSPWHTSLNAVSSYQILIPRKEPLAVGPELACGQERASRFMVPRSLCSWNHWAQSSSTAQTSSGHTYYCCPMKFYAPSPQV